MRLKYTKEASATSVCEGMVLAQSAVEDTSREGMTQLQIPSDPKLVFSVNDWPIKLEFPANETAADRGESRAVTGTRIRD